MYSTLMHAYQAWPCHHSNIGNGLELQSDWSLGDSKAEILFVTRKFIENSRPSSAGRVWRSGHKTDAILY